MTKRWLAGLGLVALAASGCSPSKRPVATVNGKEISKDDLEARLIQHPSAKSVMQQMLVEQLIFQEAEKKGIKVTDEDVNNRVQWEKDRLPPGRFEEAAVNGTSEETIRRDLRTQIAVQKLLMQGVNVSQDSIQKFYNENATLFTKPRWKQVGFIVAKDKTDAGKAVNLLKQGVDFLKVSQQFSADPQGKTATSANWQWFALEKGKLLNERRQPTGFPAPVVTAITNTGAGKSAEPVSLTGQPGSVVVRVEKDVPGGKIPLAEVQDLIALQIAQRNNQIKPVQELLEGLAKGAQIDIKLDQFKDLAKPENLLGPQGAPGPGAPPPA